MEDIRRERDQLKGAYDRFVVRTRPSSPHQPLSVRRQAASHIRHDIAIYNVAISQSRTEQAASKLIADADRGMSVSGSVARYLMHSLPAVLLDSLKPTLSARYDSASAPSGCLEHTREDVLGKLHDWINQYSPRLSIFWLAGMAGTGKTTIAKTFCDQLAQSRKLSASFFALRQAADRRDPSNIVRTLAYDLVYALPSVRSPILEFLRSTPAVTDIALQKLVNELLARPLVSARLSAASNSCVVCVIEALDECENVGNMPGGMLVPLMAAALREQPVKLLITSRLEPSIQSMLNSLAPDSFRLHNVDEHVVARDVQHYLEAGFSEIVRTHNLSNDGWPPEHDIATLTARTKHLFIYAATVLRYVDNSHYHPPSRLAELLGQNDVVTDNPYAMVDMIYQQVFLNATQTSGRDGDFLCRRLRKVVGTVIMVQQPLSVGILASLCQLSDGEIAAVLGRLSSVMLVEAGTPVRIFHQSFSDYATDPQRCTDTRFLVIPEEHHDALAVRYLSIMNEQLQYDICDIRDPSLFKSEVKDLAQRLERHVSGELRYASMHWMAHVALSGPGNDMLFEALSCFCGDHIFHWIEILSLLGRVLDADRGLRDVLTWCKVRPSIGQTSFPQSCTLQAFPESLSTTVQSSVVLLTDTLHVLRDFRIPIEAAPLQVYHSVLVFMPLCSLQACMSGRMTSIVRMVTDRDTVANCGLTLEEPAMHALSASFSTDGTRLATESHNGILRVWDVESGHIIAVSPAFQESELSASHCWTRHVAFSPDSSHVASCFEYGQLRLWNCATGSITRSLDSVRSFAYSPDGDNIAACCWIITGLSISFRLWNISTGSERTLLTPPWTSGQHAFDLIFCSAEELRVAIYDEHTRLRVWDIKLTGTDGPRALSIPDIDFGRPTMGTEFGLESRALAFSSDAKYLVLDLHTNVVMFAIEGHKLSVVSQHSLKGASPVARRPMISPDRRYIAFNSAAPSGVLPSGGKKTSAGWLAFGDYAAPDVCIWDTYKDQYTTITSLQDGLCFSPDSGTLAAVDSFSRAVTLLPLETLDLDSTARSESRSVKASLALSRDGSLLAITIPGSDLQLFNTVTGSRSYLLGCVTDRVVPCMRFSSDGHKLVYKTPQRTLEIYDVRTGTRITLLADLDRPSKHIFVRGHPWTISSCGEHLVSYSRVDGKLRLWKVLTGQVQATSDVVQGSMHDLLFTANDSRLLSTSRHSLDGPSMPTVQLWDAKTCTLVFTLETYEYCSFKTIFSHSPDGHCFALLSKDAIVLRNTRDGDILATCQTPMALHGREQLHWSPDGTHFLTYDDQLEAESKLSLWSRRDGSRVAALDLPNGISMYAVRFFFSADGRRIFWSDDHTAGCWVEGQHFPLLRATDLPDSKEAVFNPNHAVDILALSSGWLLYSCSARAGPRPFLWVPPHRRQYHTGRFLFAGTTIVLERSEGMRSILDISALLRSLSK
jgi:WD40 repeat protein